MARLLSPHRDRTFPGGRRSPRMPQLGLAALAGVVVALSLGACGGDDEGGDEKTFDEPGFDITFKYPDSLKAVDRLNFQQSAGSTAKDTKGLALNDDNLIAVQKFSLNVAVNDRNIDRVKSQVDSLVTQVAGKPVRGERVERAGIPGFQYVFDITRPNRGRSRLNLLFRDRTEYSINCQSTPDKREELEEACGTALETLATKE